MDQCYTGAGVRPNVANHRLAGCHWVDVETIRQSALTILPNARYIVRHSPAVGVSQSALDIFMSLLDFPACRRQRFVHAIAGGARRLIPLVWHAACAASDRVKLRGTLQALVVRRVAARSSAAPSTSAV